MATERGRAGPEGPARRYGLECGSDAARVGAATVEMEGVHQPRSHDDCGEPDHDVDDVRERPGAEDLGEDVGLPVGDAQDAPVEGSEDHDEKSERLESLEG